MTATLVITSAPHAEGQAEKGNPDEALAVDLYGDPLPRGATTRLGAYRYRNPGIGWKRIAFLPDNETFAVGADSEPVRLWNARSGKLIREFDQGVGGQQAFCVSPDGKSIATLSLQASTKGALGFVSQLVIWDTETGHKRRTIEWEGQMAHQMAFSPDGKLIAMCPGDGSLQLFAAATEEESRLQGGRQGEVESIVFSPDGGLVATAGRQGVVLWMMGDAKEDPIQLAGLPQGAGVVRFSPDGALLAVGSYDQGVAHLLNVRSREVVLRIDGQGNGYSTEGMCFSSDGTQLIVPNFDNFIEVFDIQTGKSISRLDSDPIDPCGVAISADGRLLASIGSRSAMNVWDLQSGERLSNAAVGHLETASEVAFTPDDQYVVTGSMDGTIRIWEAATGRQQGILAHTGCVAALAMSSQGERIASLSLDDAVRLWDVATGQEAFKRPGHGNTGGSSTSNVAFSPDGKRIYSFGADMRLQTYETPTGRMVGKHSIHPSGVPVNNAADGAPGVAQDPFGDPNVGFALDRVRFTPDASQLLLGSRSKNKIHFFDVETGREIEVFEPEEPWRDFLVSPDGKLLITFEQLAPTDPAQARVRLQATTVCVRDFASKEKLRETLLPGSFSYVAAFSPDGKSIGFTMRANAKGDKLWSWKVSVVDVETLEEVAKVDIQPNSIRSLAFSNDGTLLATSRDDSTVLIWDLTQVRTAPDAAP